MNYLAHLYIAEQTKTSHLGSLLGDFVKGSDYKNYSQEIGLGIELHRYVDSYIDSHPLVLEAKRLFEGKARRFSGIALDMLWDHFLALHWHEYDDQPLEQFCKHCEKEIAQKFDANLPDRFLKVNQLIWKQRWLQSYQEMDNIRFALERISKRRTAFSQLTECYPYLELHYQDLLVCFDQVYPDVLNAAKTYISRR
jgi:acyl carrier protein phosphodiesterase